MFMNNLSFNPILMQHLRENFLKTYANIPLNLRDEIILVFKDKPLTWNVAYLEVKENSKASKEILQELYELKLI